MIPRLTAVTLALCLAFPVAGQQTAGQRSADDATKETTLATCHDVPAAQNARDLEAVRAFFVDGPGLLWVSDGRPFRGRAATLARMGLFRGADVWRVTPDLDEARVMSLADHAAMLHCDPIREIGRAEGPNRVPFRVSILSVDPQDDGSRIASLRTTGDKQPSQ